MDETCQGGSLGGNDCISGIKILKDAIRMQYHLVEILTHLVLLQAVLQKHFMEFSCIDLQSVEVGWMKA